MPRPFRTYADDEGWYEYFQRLAGQAACMVMPVANSDNLQQELTFIRREGLQRRLFIFTNHPLDPNLEVPSRLHFWLYWWIKPVLWILFRLGSTGPPVFTRIPTWDQIAQNVGKLGFDFGDDPGRGAVVTFDSEGKAKVLVKGAQTPSEFVEPIRDYLVQTFGLDLDGAAAAAEANQVKISSKIAVSDLVQPHQPQADRIGLGPEYQKLGKV